jgi:hypothetical protein
VDGGDGGVLLGPGPPAGGVAGGVVGGVVGGPGGADGLAGPLLVSTRVSVPSPSTM